MYKTNSKQQHTLSKEQQTGVCGAHQGLIDQSTTSLSAEGGGVQR
jgi:hypothetical protein